jgi:alkylhydroperoxidase family enzyme
MEIEPADEGVLSADDRERLNALPPLNIYRLLAIVPRALVPWTDLVAAVYGARLEPRLREIAICRQARTARAEYELHQHRLIARNNGVTDSELEAIMGEPVVQSLDEHANLVCRAADEMETTATLSDETLGSLVTWLGEAPTTDLILALSVYCAVARFTNATRASIEVGDPLSNASNPGLH